MILSRLLVSCPVLPFDLDVISSMLIDHDG